jgi:hypothetical protein
VADDHLPSLVLIRNQGSDVRLDATSSETNNDDGNDESTKTSAVIESGWDGSASQDKETNHVDTAEDENGVVLSKVLISNDSTCRAKLVNHSFRFEIWTTHQE